MWKENDSGMKEKEEYFFIILIGNLYYFIELYVKIKPGCRMSCKMS